MKYKFADEDQLDLLAEWNHQLIHDEGHRNKMTIIELRERMKEWLDSEYKAIIFSTETDTVAYALYRETLTEIYLRQLFVKRDRRREGIGREAIDILRSKVWTKKKRLTVEVLTANDSAVKFWHSVGYKDYCLTLEIIPEN